MTITHTEIPGLLIIQPQIFEDNRGHFFESYNLKNFKKDIPYQFVQDNESKSFRGVIRGLHYQLNPYAQAKLIRVVHGKILDIAVDIRRGSLFFGKWFGVVLSAENKKQILLPPGFAHGFSVLSESATVFYKCSEFYQPGAEKGINCFDPTLAIDWGIDPKKVILSDRDKNLPDLGNTEMNFIYEKV